MKVSELFENTYSPSTLKGIQMPALIKLIETDCSDILAAYRMTGETFFRGIKDAPTNANAIDVKIRPDRKPVEMDEAWHNTLNQAFLKCGLKATRTNSIFCTTRGHLAANWGRAMIPFPRNGWNMTVFEKISDDYVYKTLKNLQTDSANMAEKDIPKWLSNEIKKLGAENINGADHQAVAKVIEDYSADVLIAGQSYIAVKPSFALLERLGIRR